MGKSKSGGNCIESKETPAHERGRTCCHCGRGQGTLGQIQGGEILSHPFLKDLVKRLD